MFYMLIYIVFQAFFHDTRLIAEIPMSIDLDYLSLGKSEDNELCKEFQVVLG